jgi:hypothetical protein
MAKKTEYPTKTPDVEKKVSEKEREKGGYGMAEKGGVAYPPSREEPKKKKK